MTTPIVTPISNSWSAIAKRDGATLYAYVLMPNYVHLLLETGDRPLSCTMQILQFTYSQYYTRRYDKTGHVFQGRYHAILRDRDA